MILEEVDSFLSVRDEWARLPIRSMFSTPEWHETWWRHFGAERDLLLRAARADGRLVGVLPLYRSRARPVRIVRFTGHPQGDELGPVGFIGAAAAGEALDQALTAIEHDVFLGEQLPGEQAWAARLRARRFRLEAGPVIRSRSGWQSYLAARSANFRQQLHRRERRLRERYEVVFRLATDSAALERDLDLLFALHRARWGPASGFAPEAFHREIARRAFDAGRLRLWFLELDGTAAAAWYGFRVGGVESYYQAGRASGHDDDSLGFVLLAHTIREALDDGVDEYRLLRGDEGYKRRFADDDPGLETIIRAGSARGSLVVATALAAKRARGALSKR